MSNNQDYQSLQDGFRKMSLKEEEKKNDQPLRNSTYNIMEAYNDNIPSDFSLIMECQSIHPLQSCNPYDIDLDQKQNINRNENDINELMETLDLNDTATRSLSTPYSMSTVN